MPDLRAPVVAPHKQRRHASVAQARRQPGKATLLLFYSAVCPLCQALRTDFDQIQQQHAWVATADICADDFEAWAPEMLRYSVDAVPCLVLLDSQGVTIGILNRSVQVADKMLLWLQSRMRTWIGSTL